MSRKSIKFLATACVLSLASVAMAQDDTTTTTLQSLIGLIGPIAGIIWMYIFVAWGGFKWIFG